MRPYRGWTKDGKEIKGWYCEVDGKHYIIPDDAQLGRLDPDTTGSWDCAIGGQIEVIPETVGQFTGLCDKTGKEIYEGDIVHSNWVDVECQEGEEYTGAIYYKKGSFWLQTELSGYDPNWFEIIGNIHESPSLMEEKQR